MYLSKMFRLERGVRQGCPLSPLLYVLASETLLSTIRKSESIGGFIGPENKVSKVKGYADDTMVYVRNIELINYTIQVLEQYGQASESRLNRDKTFILMCGTLKDTYPSDPLLNFSNDKMKTLGVWVGNGDVTNDNWLPAIRKLCRALNLWKCRDLTAKGKAVVVNTIALSKLWYLAILQRGY